MAGSARPSGATRLLGVRAGGWLLHLSGLVHERVQAPGSPGWTAPRYCLHDVRHAVATELGRRGVQPVIVSAVLGHASPSFTIAVYQHAWVEGPSEAAAALEAALGPFVLRPSVVGNPLAQDAVEASVDPAGGLESAGQERGAGRTRT